MSNIASTGTLPLELSVKASCAAYSGGQPASDTPSPNGAAASQSNNPALAGFGLRRSTRSAQMEAFDELTPAVREALRNAAVSFSPIQVLELYRLHGEAVVLRAIAAGDADARAAMRAELAELSA